MGAGSMHAGTNTRYQSILVSSMLDAALVFSNVEAFISPCILHAAFSCIYVLVCMHREGKS